MASIPARTARFERWRHCHERRGTSSIPVGPDDHSSGPEDAKLTVVEYGDYQCPYCGQAFPIVEKLRTQFADSMRFVFRNFPLADVHPHAVAAAETAEAVALQGKFWEIHDALFENQRDLSDGALRTYAQAVGADVDKAVRTSPGAVRRSVSRRISRARFEAARTGRRRSSSTACATTVRGCTNRSPSTSRRYSTADSSSVPRALQASQEFIERGQVRR